MFYFAPNLLQPSNSMSTPSHWLVIVNPNSGTRKGIRDWKDISHLLVKEGFAFDARFTEGIGHAIRITQEKILEGYRRIIVVGGDGTMNEVINGIFSQQAVPSTEITVAMIPVGTGNDWSRMYGIPAEYHKAVKIIHEEHSVLQDVGVAIYQNGGTDVPRYFVNAAGIGFDAEVVRKTNNDKQHGKGGFLIYLKNLLISLAGYNAQKVTMEVDGNTREGEFFSLSIGICRYTGGGMIQAPNAKPDDGLLDVTIIRKIGRLEVIRNIPRLFNGTIGKNPHVELLQGKVVKVSAEKKIYLEADGETLGHSPFSFRIIPLAVRTVTARPLQ